jgi:hypothetical protein
MKGASADLWKGYVPKLFSEFDPCESFLRGATPRFRNATGKQLLDVDESIELLLLGHGALRQVGGKALPSPAQWLHLLEQVTGAMTEHLPVFDLRGAAMRDDPRRDLVKPFTYTNGTLEILLFNAVLQSLSSRGIQSTVTMGLLSLMWLDRTLYALRREPLEALEYVLRARQLLGEALLLESRTEFKKERAKAAARAKLANDPKQRLMDQAKEMWAEHRRSGKSKAALARDILKKLPDLESTENLLQRFRDWEKELDKPDS